MKHLLGLLLLLAPSLAARAQESGAFLAGQRQPAVVSITPQYERYTFGGVTLSQVSTSAYAFYPVRRDVAFALRAGHAVSEAAGGASLSGVTDVHLSGSYARDLGAGSVVLGLSGTLPSGRQRIARAEFDEFRAFGLDYYGFRVPGFGQGPSASPSATLAFPFSEAVVFGAGASYVYRGGFKPFADMVDKYNPGDEVLLTGGLDVRLGEAARLALDLTYALYGADKVGEDEVYEAGNRLVAAVQLRRAFGARDLWLLARYRSRGDNYFRAVSGLIPEAETSTPNRFDLRARYGLPLGRRFRLALLTEGVFLAQTRDYPTSLVDVGLAPELLLSRHLALPARFTYRLSDMSGFEASLGLTASF